MSKSLPEIAMQYSRAWVAHDPAAIAAMHTDDSVFHLHDVGAPASGRDAVRDLVAALLADTPDLHFEPTRAHFGTDHFVSEYVMSGTTAGKQFAIDGVDVFTIHDGLVARKDSYLDWLAYQRQVGLDPAARLKALGH